MIDSKGHDFGCLNEVADRERKSGSKFPPSMRSILPKQCITKITKVKKKFAGKFMGRESKIILTDT
jgi:hypothetical protein